MRMSNRSGATLHSWTTAITAGALLILALYGSSCRGDSPVDPVVGDDPPSPGEGTRTLHVVVEVQGRSVNGTVSETEFLATVADVAGAPISGATVVVSGRFGDVQLEEVAPGSYGAVQPGYEDGAYTLNVTSGADNVTGVTVRAPDIQTVSTPTAHQVVQSSTPLDVRWTSQALASECRLETRDYDSDWISGDTGTLWIPSVGNPPRTDQRIRIERRNHQVPQGGLPGSWFFVGIRCTVEPVVAQ